MTNIQDEVQKIHHQYGMSEMTNYKIQLLCERYAKEYHDSEVKKLNIPELTIPAVVKSLPTDECVEQRWAEGQDQNEGFWQEAPYRTNGDVVEEIKTALKYFIETWQR